MPNWAPMDEERFYIWLAGFVDGDGMITINRGTKDDHIELMLGNTNEEVIRYIHERLKVGSVSARLSIKAIHKQSFYYKTTGFDAAPIIENIMPYLRIKHKQARVALDFQSTKTHTRCLVPLEIQLRRDQLVKEIRELNAKGNILTE